MVEKAAVGHAVKQRTKHVAVFGLLMLSMSVLLWIASRNQLIATNDELYHLLAAQSLIRDGSLSIGFGEYQRAGLFTWLISLSYQLGGESFLSAQVISGLFVSALTGAIFLLTYPLIGRRAAAISTLLFAFSINTLDVGTTVRFYGIHALFFFVGCVLFFRMLNSGARSHQFLFGAASGISLLFAFYFQVTTAIGVLALFAWFTGFAIWWLWNQKNVSARVKTWIVVSLLIAGIVTLHFVPLEQLIRDYRFQALWSQTTNPRIYYWMISDLYGVFFGLYPVFAIVAVVKHPRIATLAIALFVLPVVVHSFGGMRAHRYIFYTLPFFFIICAIGIVEILDWLRGLLIDFVQKSAIKVSNTLNSILLVAMLGTTSIILIVANEGYQSGLKSVHQGYTENRRSPPGWLSVDKFVSNDRFEVIVTANTLETLYYLGRPSFQFHGDAPGEFEIDRRTGLPKISRTESIRRIMDCFSSILVLSDERTWDRPSGVGFDPETTSYINSEFSNIELPSDIRIHAYYWVATEASASSPSGCEDLRVLTSDWPTL